MCLTLKHQMPLTGKIYSFPPGKYLWNGQSIMSYIYSWENIIWDQKNENSIEQYQGTKNISKGFHWQFSDFKNSFSSKKYMSVLCVTIWFVVWEIWKTLSIATESMSL